MVTPANLTILGAEAGDWLALVSSQQYDSLSRARVGGGAGHRRGMGHNLSTPGSGGKRPALVFPVRLGRGPDTASWHREAARQPPLPQALTPAGRTHSAAPAASQTCRLGSRICDALHHRCYRVKGPT